MANGRKQANQTKSETTLRASSSRRASTESQQGTGTTQSGTASPAAISALTTSLLLAKAWAAGMAITHTDVEDLEHAVENEALNTRAPVTVEARNSAINTANFAKITFILAIQDEDFWTRVDVPPADRVNWQVWEHDRWFKALKEALKPEQKSNLTALAQAISKINFLEIFDGRIPDNVSIAEISAKFFTTMQETFTAHGLLINDVLAWLPTHEGQKPIVDAIKDRFKHLASRTLVLRTLHEGLEVAKPTTVMQIIVEVGKVYKKILGEIAQGNKYSVTRTDNGSSRDTDIARYGQCPTCGGHHNLDERCEKRNHPDASRNGVPWIDSEKGKIYAGLGRHKLSSHSKLAQNNGNYYFVPIVPIQNNSGNAKPNPFRGGHYRSVSRSTTYVNRITYKNVKSVTFSHPLTTVIREGEGPTLAPTGPHTGDARIATADNLIREEGLTTATSTSATTPIATTPIAAIPATETRATAEAAAAALPQGTQEATLPAGSPDQTPSLTTPPQEPRLPAAVTAVVADGSRTAGSRASIFKNRLNAPQVLLDSGSTLNFIDMRTCLHLKLTLINTKKMKVKTLYGFTYATKMVTIPILNLIYKNEKVQLKNQSYIVLDDSVFPIIVGLNTIRNHDLTGRLRSYFTNTEERQKRSQKSAIETETYLNRILVTTWNKPQEGGGVQAGHLQPAPPPASPTPRRDRPSANQQSAAANTKSPTPHYHGSTRHISELLQGELDDDPTHYLPNSNWTRYFEAAQGASDPLQQTPQWEIHSGGAEREILLTVLQNNADRFSNTISSEPALLPPFEIKVNKDLWMKHTSRQGYVRPQSPAKDDALRKLIEKALSDDLIEASQAARFSQVLLTMKQNNTYRFCVDYRELNAASESLGWPIPNIKGLLNRIGAKKPKYFAVMDLTSGYHQAPLAVASREATAFITSIGLFQWKRVPMGPKGAPSYFQGQMVNTIFPGLIHNILEVYLDDIITWADTVEELAERLEQIFERLRRHNVTLNPDKCRFGMTEVEYVGHVIDEHGLTFSSAKLDKVETFRRPDSLKSLRSFLGLAGYFRDHIRDHATIVQPLQALLDGYDKRKASTARILWTEELTTAFENIKSAIIDCPKLHFLIPGHSIHLQTDASDYGIGAYLFQLVDGIETPIAFLSKTLSKTERKWSTLEKEAFAIYFSLTKWEHYLRDAQFTLQTDHLNLTYLNQETSPKVQRWKLAVQEYDFVVEHIKGVNNIVADGLSRFCPYPTKDEPQPPVTSINAIWAVLNEDHPELPPQATNNKATTSKRNPFKEYTIPAPHYDVLRKIHNSQVGHWKIQHTVNRVNTYLAKNPAIAAKLSNWTPAGIRRDATAFIQKCPCCQKMDPICREIITHPYVTSTWGIFDNIAIDTIMGLPETPEGHKNLLVIIDTFSRYIELFPMKELTAIATTAHLREWMNRYGRPLNILTDNASQFQDVFAATLKNIGIHSNKTHPYSHQENSIVERANRDILRHLRNI